VAVAGNDEYLDQAQRPSRIGAFLAELQRRRVPRAIAAYAIAAFAALQVVEPVQHGLGLPEWMVTAVVIAVGLGFPVAVTFAWAFDLTVAGVTRTPAGRAPGDAHVHERGHVRSFTALVAASALLGAGVAGIIVWRIAKAAPPVEADGRVRVAVADFANETHDPELDGLSWMLVSSLAESRRLAVVTRVRMVDELRKAGRPSVPVLDEAAGRDAARALGVRRLVLAAVHRLGGRHAIDLRVLDPATGEYLFALREQGEDKASVQEMIDRIAARARERLHAEQREEIRISTAKVADVTTANLEAWRHYVQGLKGEDAMRNGIALDEYRKAVAIDPGFALAHYRIAYVGERMAVDVETRRAAIQAAVGGLDRMPAKERLLVQAWKAKMEGRPQDASAVYARAAEAFPQDKEVLSAVGDFRYEEGRYAEALPWFERAVDLDPAWEPALASLVETLSALDRAEDATRRAAQWAEKRPGGESYRTLASAHLFAGQFVQAVEAARRALELEPGIVSRRSLAESLVYDGQAEEAEALLRPFFTPTARIEDRRSASEMMIQALEHQGRRREALRIADAAPLDAASHHWTRHVLLLGDPDPRPSLREARESMRLGHPAVQWLAPSALILRDEKLASEAARHIKYEGLRSLYDGLLAWRHGNGQGALEILRPLRSRPSGFRVILDYWLARIAFETRRDAEGIASVEQFERGPTGVWRAWNLADLLVWKAEAHERLGERDKAIATVDRLLAGWKHADADLPRLAEAKALRARLGESTWPLGQSPGSPARAQRR
jgi:eukaryotic-like serine/threonine-protein kinase